MIKLLEILHRHLSGKQEKHTKHCITSSKTSVETPNSGAHMIQVVYHTCIPIDKHLFFLKWSFFLSSTATVAMVVVVVTVAVLFPTCWLAGPWICALAASMAAVSAFILSKLSVELLSPDWLMISPLCPCPSMYASWADSVLLWAVMEINGLVVVLGGTGGGVFL